MPLSNFSKARPIPTRVTTKKTSPTTTNFAKGIFTYKPNDTMDYDEIYLAQNARFDRIGEYKTRRGLMRSTDPDRNIHGNTYTNNYEMVPINGLYFEFVSSDIDDYAPEHLYSIDLTIAAENETDYGVFQLSLYNSDTNELLGCSCAEKLPTTPTSKNFIFKSSIPTGINVTAKLGVQGTTKQTFKVACPTGTTTPMYRIKTSPKSKIIGLFQANIQLSNSRVIRPVFYVEKRVWNYDVEEGDRTGVRLKVYDPASGSLNTIRDTMDSNIEKVRFIQVKNEVRYADGAEGPRLLQYNSSTSTWTDSAIPTIDLKTGTNLNIKVSNILEGTEDNVIYFDATTNTQAVWTYPYGFIYNNSSINSYDKFDRDFRQNFPAIETGDPLTAMFNLGGIIYFLTRQRKYYMYSQTADVWTQQASSAQHGTFSQESCVCDINYAYYANDDGIYVFDGSSEESITQSSIQSTYDEIKNKESISMSLYNNRLYVFYSSKGDNNNDCCLVYNINLRLWESFDTGLPISIAIGRRTPSNRFYCGSSQFDQIYVYEGDYINESNKQNYSDLGAPIDFDLETSYLHFGTPSQLHRITKWRPEFSKVAGEYAIKCGYALDFTDDVKYAFSIDLHNNSPINEHYVWDNPPDYGNKVTPTKLTTIPQVNGQFYRCQIRYQLHSAFTPVNFKSHTLACEIQRLR